MTQGTFEQLHSRCMHGGGCAGPGCTRTKTVYSTAEPRVRTNPTKGERKLAARIAAFNQHGEQPPNITRMRKPGSENFRAS